MTPYGTEENAGVAAYALLEHGIILQFKNDSFLYLYDNVAPGGRHVAAMKTLAMSGKGLTTYVNKHIRGNYRKKWNP